MASKCKSSKREDASTSWVAKAMSRVHEEDPIGALSVDSGKRWKAAQAAAQWELHRPLLVCDGAAAAVRAPMERGDDLQGDGGSRAMAGAAASYARRALAAKPLSVERPQGLKYIEAGQPGALGASGGHLV